jgi:hypothetical protein
MEEPFPPVPTSLHAGDHEWRERYASPAGGNIAHTDPQYTPYLGLRARLSQTWINKWTILLFLILCRVLLAIRNLDDNIEDAKTQALSACTSVENVGSAMASMPHYLSMGVNSLAADGVTHAINGLMGMLMLSISAVEEIVLFVINMMTSTYVCLITLVISGSLHVAIDMIEKVGDFFNSTIKKLTSEITSDLSSFQTDLNTFLKAISDVTGFFGGSKTPPTIDLSKPINSLNAITIDPSTMDTELTKLNASIPNFEQVHNFTNNLIRLPFEKVKQLVNESRSAYKFDQSIFPLAQKQALTFCSDNTSINDFFGGLASVASLARKIFIIVVSVLAVLVCIPMAYREIWRWRTLQQRAKIVQMNAFDPLDVIYISSRPYTSTAGIKVASRFKSTKRQVLTRWAVAYATSAPALFVLMLGIAGLFSCLCQWILLKSIQKEVPALATQVGSFAGTVVTALNNASEQWAVSANGVIKQTNTKVNNDVFGWVNITTGAVNNTLNAFVDNTTSVLNATFGGTILYTPIMETLKCLVLLKVTGIQKGLTWASDNAHVTFPEFNKDVFSLGAAASLTNSTDAQTFLTSPGSEATDDVTAAIVKVTNKMTNAIVQEVYISSALIGVYLLICLIGIGRTLIGFFSRDKTRGEGGARFTGDGRTSISTGSPREMSKDSGAAQFPEFGPPVSSVGMPASSDEDGAWAAEGLSSNPVDEKRGHAGQRSVSKNVISKAHNRSSSYGYVAGTKN